MGTCYIFGGRDTCSLSKETLFIRFKILVHKVYSVILKMDEVYKNVEFNQRLADKIKINKEFSNYYAFIDYLRNEYDDRYNIGKCVLMEDKTFWSIWEKGLDNTVVTQDILIEFYYNYIKAEFINYYKYLLDCEGYRDYLARCNEICFYDFKVMDTRTDALNTYEMLLYTLYGSWVDIKQENICDIMRTLRSEYGEGAIYVQDGAIDDCLEHLLFEACERVVLD